MKKKKPVKKTAKKVTKAPAKKASSRSSSVTKVKTSSQFKLISIYILLGIIFLGYIFYHSTQNKQPTTVNDYPVEMSK
jgi:RsiW-degrading membrane proteinase PrsW (M82 family)